MTKGASVTKSIILADAYISVLFIILFSSILLVVSIHQILITITLSCLCIWSLFGFKHAIQALSLSVVVKFLNPALYEFSSEAGILSWLVIFSAGLRILPTVSTRHIAVLTPLVLYASVVAALAVYASLPLKPGLPPDPTARRGRAPICGRFRRAGRFCSRLR